MNNRYHGKTTIKNEQGITLKVFVGIEQPVPE